MNPLVVIVAKHDLLLAAGAGIVLFLALASLQIGVFKSFLAGLAATMLVVVGITEVLPMVIPALKVQNLSDIIAGIKN